MIPYGPITSDFLILSFSTGVTTKGSDYASLNLQDKNKNKIMAKFWDYDPKTHFFMREGKVIKVEGQVSDYNGKAQLTARRVLPSIANHEDFMITTKFDVQSMWDDVLAIVSEMKDPMAKFVCEEVLLLQAEKIQKAPAAKAMHNN